MQSRRNSKAIFPEIHSFGQSCKYEPSTFATRFSIAERRSRTADCSINGNSTQENAAARGHPLTRVGSAFVVPAHARCPPLYPHGSVAGIAGTGAMC
jgi:hypothetical protein